MADIAVPLTRPLMVPVAEGLREARAIGGAAPALAPIGSQILFYGDGVMSEGACPGFRNMPSHVLMLMNGRVIPSPAWMQCKSGGDMDTIYARRAPAINQQTDIPAFVSQGHNDGLLTTDPDLNATLLDKWKRNLDAWVAGHPNAYWIPVCGTVPSDVAGETTASSFNPAISIRQRVWDLQEAYVASKADARIFFIKFSTYVPADNASDTGNVHSTNAGGRFGGNLIFNALDDKVEAATKDEILEMMRGGTYPNLSATNLHPDVLMTGTAGTKSGTVAPTGDYATGQRITNNLTNGTGIAVTCSKDTAPDPYDRQIVTVAGTPAAEATTVQDDTGNITLTGADKGMYALFAEEVVIDDGAGGAPHGLWRFNFALGNYGQLGTTAASDSATGAPIAHAVDCCMIAAPRAIFGSGTFVANPALTNRWDDIDLTTNRVIISRPMIRFVSTPNQGPAAYVGGDTILSSNYLLRISGTISATTFGTVTIETGMWAPYGVTFSEKRLYRGGGAGGTEGTANHGAGTLFATISAAGTWTYATGASDGLVAGEVIYLEITGISGTGGAFTARSNTGITVAA